MSETSISQQQIDDAHLQHFAGLGSVLPDNRTTNFITVLPDENQSASPVAAESTQSAKDVAEVTEFTTRNVRPLWASPWLKLLVAGSGIFLILIVVGLGLNNSISGVTTQSQTPATTAQGDITTAPTADEKDGELNTKVAITTQVQELQNFNKEALKSKPPTKNKPVSTKTAHRVTEPVTRFSPQLASVPVSASPLPRQQVVPRTTWQAVETVTQPKPVTQPDAPTPALDPMEQWNAAANIGSYGTVVPISNPPTADSDSGSNATQPSSTTTAGSNSQASSGLGEAPQQANITTKNSDWQPSNTDATQNAQSQTQPRASQPQTPQIENKASYSSDPSTLVSVGTKTSGKLDTPIRWSGDSLQNSELPNLLIKLTKPLKTVGGFEAIPAGSYLSVQVISADSAGILQLSPILVQLRDGQEKALPEGAISIFDKKGNVLQAKFHAPRTRKSFLSEVGDAAGIAGLATDNSSLYVLNALGNRQNSQPKPSYFSLDKDTLVELYVNQSFSF